MQYKLLGRTGMRVSPVCFGTMTFGREASKETSKRLFAICREAGLNFFDTANMYGNGLSEEILGECMVGSRDKLIVATKAFYPVQNKGPNQRGSSRRHLVMQVEQSLRRLRTDWIDLFYLHGPDPSTPLEETMRALDDLVKAGKILTIGVSNHAAWQVMKAIGIAKQYGWTPIHAIQPMYSLLKRQVEVELLPMAQSEGLGVMPYSPLGAGLLTGKYLEGKAEKEARFQSNEKYQRRYGMDWVEQGIRGFVDIAQELGVKPAALAVAWVMANPAVTSPILGARNEVQLKESLEALSIEMDDTLYQRISDLTPKPPPPTDRLEEQGWISDQQTAPTKV